MCLAKKKTTHLLLEQWYNGSLYLSPSGQLLEGRGGVGSLFAFSPFFPARNLGKKKKTKGSNYQDQKAFFWLIFFYNISGESNSHLLTGNIILQQIWLNHLLHHSLFFPSWVYTQV